MRILPFVLIALVAGFAWWLLADQTRNATPVAAVSRSPHPEAKPTTGLSEPSSLEFNRPVIPERTAQELPRDPAPSHQVAPQNPPAGQVRVEGFVIVIDANGVEHAGENGTLTVSAIRESRFKNGRSRSTESSEEVAVQGGRFQADIPEGKLFGVEKLTLGGRDTVALFEPASVVPGQPVVVRARWVERLRLVVRDAKTLQHLDDIMLVRCTDWRSSDFLHPGPYELEDIVLEHGISPLEVVRPRDFAPPRDDQIELRQYWVTARGHAWKRIELDFTTETERDVLLEPAATLVVNVTGELPAARDAARSDAGDEQDQVPMLRLRKAGLSEAGEYVAKAMSYYDELEADAFSTGVKPSREDYERMLRDWIVPIGMNASRGEVFAERAAVIGETRFDRLPPGDLEAAIEVGHHWNPTCGGEIRVTMIAGIESRIELVSVAPSPTPDRVPLSGTLHIPAGWPTQDLYLDIGSVNSKGTIGADVVEIEPHELREVPGRIGWYHWDAGKVRPARYRFVVEDAGFSQQIDIGSSGNQEVELRLDEPATLMIQLIDEATGQVVSEDDSEFEGWMVWDSANGAQIQLDPKATESDSMHRGIVPVGLGRLRVFGDRWTESEPPKWQEARAGLQELRCVIRRACGVIVALACEGESLAWLENMGFELEIEAVGHPGEFTMRSLMKPLLQVSAPGRYRLKVPTIPGYAPVDAVEVEIPAGRYLEHTIELRRLR